MARKQGSDGQTFVCTMPYNDRRHGRAMSFGAAGMVAEAITLIESGQVARGVTTLRSLLAEAGHPRPAPFVFETHEPKGRR